MNHPSGFGPCTAPGGGELARPTVLKLGGELIDAPDRLRVLAGAIAALAMDGPLVVVHGGGREIDADLSRRGLSRVAVDGVRVTDASTLEVVVAVLAGTVNTRLVAALAARQLPAVGLTGADAASVPVTKARPHRTVGGPVVDLGLVGEPVAGDAPRLIADLLRLNYVPVVASIGLGPMGALYNVNADTLAAALACRVRARRLLVAGTTPGVLGRNGWPLTSIDTDAVDVLVRTGTASNGMVAKLSACRAALDGGVEDVRIIGIREGPLLEAPGTRVRRSVRPAADLAHPTDAGART